MRRRPAPIVRLVSPFPQVRDTGLTLLAGNHPEWLVPFVQVGMVTAPCGMRRKAAVALHQLCNSPGPIRHPLYGGPPYAVHTSPYE
ncbi:hypothetical protein GCM10010416_54370 [Streptomyces caniferus]